MQLFIDSAHRERLAPLLDTGMFAGVTTNPTLLARAGVNIRQLPEFVTWVRGRGAKTVFVQAWGVTAEDYVTCATGLLDDCGDVDIKVPVTPAGVVAARSLEERGVRTLLTGVYSHLQVVPALLAKATYVAPYLGRMNDAGLDGMAEIRHMQSLIDAARSTTRILVASIRTASELATLAMAGVQSFTVTPELWSELLAQRLTEEAVEVFDADVRKLLD